MGFFDDISNFGKRGLQGLGRIPTDEQMALRTREMDLREQELQSLLPLREEELQNSRFARKLNMSQLAAENDLAAGFGQTRGQMAARQMALGMTGQMADIQARQQETKSQAYLLAQAQRPLADKLSEIRSLKGLATGTTEADQEAFERVAKATENDQNARKAELMASFSQDFGAVDANASKLLGRPATLFGGDDAMKAVGEFEKLLAQGMPEDQAYAQVLSTGMNLAQQKFRLLTEPGIGPEQGALPAGIEAFVKAGKRPSWLPEPGSDLGGRIPPKLPFGISSGPMFANPEAMKAAGKPLFGGP